MSERLLQDLTADLSTRTTRAFLSNLSPASAPLRTFLRETYSGWTEDAFLAEPVFEAKYPFEEADRSMDALASAGILSRSLVDAMDAPPKAFAAQRFGRDWHPYTHQELAWSHIRKKRSIVVSSGTGSGKTECFLVPILDGLARRADAGEALEGVEALFLYPLNALINSQRERLSAWTRPFKGRIRYCLYNGETPETFKKGEQKQCPEQIRSRELLRESPPSILVTNATMLEYMLVRPKDQRILQRSQGRLRYIVLDEAHTYVGSQAAELALLLRRVMEAFAVDPQDVRFIATSATISSGAAESERALKAFLGSLSGQGPGNIEVVTGTQSPPKVRGQVKKNSGLPDVSKLQAADSATRYTALAKSSTARKVRQTLITEGPKTLKQLSKLIFNKDSDDARKRTLRFLDIGHTATHPNDDVPFLPLRAHFFVRTTPGLWACLNPACSLRAGTALDTPEWPFGRVYTHLREVCACGGRVLELNLCNNCGESWLEARRDTDPATGITCLLPTTQGALFRAEELSEEEGIIAEDDPGEANTEPAEVRMLIGRANLSRDPEKLDPIEGRLTPTGKPFAILDAEEGESQACLRCNHPRRGDRNFYRPARTGSLFTLSTVVPALLERTPPTEKDAHARPLQGRRTLTFTDSRQGSARFAARLQGDAERSFVRSFLYRQLLANRGGGSSAEKKALEERIAKLAPLAADPTFKTMLHQAQQKLATLGQPKAISLTDLKDQLNNDHTFRFIHVYRKQYDPFNLSSEQLAELLLLREFARRPALRASLETLGLADLRYAFLADGPPKPPDVWKKLPKTTDEEWGSFLRICMDFFVRSYAALSIPQTYFRWMGTEIRLKTLISPGEDIQGWRQPWPQVSGQNRTNRLVRLLQRVFGFDLSEQSDRADINAILQAAWQTLIARGALIQEDNGYRLDIRNQLQLAYLPNAWLCPITRGLLSTTLRGHTPYQPTGELRSGLGTTCQEVTMPTPPFAGGRWLDSGKPISSEEIRAWLENNESVVVAREAGAWSEFSDRIATFQDYYRVAEHSAQLSSEELKANEAAFNASKINVLSCSTTMEMGVDIGQLKAVALNNAPPSPANFLQRVGRAGRRKESLSLSLTVCRSMPHDQLVFRNPTWPFTTPITLPEVRLDSARIVERHIAALCLTRYLAQIGVGMMTLEAGWFFNPPEGATIAPCDNFLGELQTWQSATPTDLASSLSRMVRGSILQMQSAVLLLERVESMAKRTIEGWRTERGHLEDELNAIPEAERETSPAGRAVQRRLWRIDGEYLLSTLADRQFLPGYGFPTGVLPFVTDTGEELAVRRQKRNTSDPPREERPRRRRSYPTRDLPMAIREYAPGAKVVLDGRVYQSSGVTLNWKYQPAVQGSDNATQAFKALWSCSVCGEVTAVPEKSGESKRCPSCSAAMSVQPYLEPAGFAVDIRYKAHTDMGQRSFIPVEPPTISIETPFQPLGAPVVGRFRSTDSGGVFSLSRGESGHGYAICLACGRAASEHVEPHRASSDNLPAALRGPNNAGHTRLRGGKRDQGNANTPNICEGSTDPTSFSIKRHQALGGRRLTDVFELQLRDPQTNMLPGKKVAATLAVVLRNALAERVGVEASEISYGIAPRQWDESGYGILLYDSAAGGAGFSTSATHDLQKLLRSAISRLNCPKNCNRACDHCLLGFDTQHDLELLDRTAALAFTTSGMLDALSLPDEHRRFGEDSQVEWMSPGAALLRLTQGEACTALRLFVQGAPDDWDLGSRTGWDVITRLTQQSVPVSLVFPAGSLTNLGWQHANQLAALASLSGCTLAEARWSDPAGPQKLLAEMETPTGVIGLSTDAAESAMPGQGWLLSGEEERLVRGPTSLAVADLKAIDLQTLRKPPPGHYRRLELSPPPLAGSASGFGERFLKALSVRMPEVGKLLGDAGPAEEIRYSDRYIASPSSVSAWYSVINALRGRGVLVPSQTRVQLSALYVDRLNSRGYPHKVSNNWGNNDDHRDVMKELLGSLSREHALEYVASRSDISHARCLEIRWASGRVLKILPDQGLGFMSPDDVRFPFNDELSEQVSQIMASRWRVKALSHEPSLVYVLLG